MSGVSLPPLSPDVDRRGRDRKTRARLMRRRIALGSAGLLLLSWNAVAVLGDNGGSKAGSLGSGNGGSIDSTAPVTTQQS